MTRPLTRIALLALASIVGIVGMLLTDGIWDWLFLALATLPPLLGGLMVAWRAGTAIRDYCDEISARAAEW